MYRLNISPTPTGLLSTHSKTSLKQGFTEKIKNDREVWERFSSCLFYESVDLQQKDDIKKPLCFINPVIKKQSDEKSVYEEGCLSLPDTFIEIERPKLCWIEYIDIDGKKKEIKCDDLLSTCIQHEVNHLDGRLIIDYLSKLKRDIIIKKLSKIKQDPDRIVV